MNRLCDRPGCAAPAAAVYGMEHERLLVWLEAVPAGLQSGRSDSRSNVVCRRHADAMAVPRGWTLDDRREPMPRLFKVIDTAPLPAHGRPSRPARARPFDGDGQPQLTFDDIDRAQAVIDAVAEADPEGSDEMPWRPVFDTDDDLDGLLKTKSPLLSRAFHGRNRQRH